MSEERPVNLHDLAFQLRAIATGKAESLLSAMSTTGRLELEIGDQLKEEIDALFLAASILNDHAADLENISRVTGGELCKSVNERYVLYNRTYYDHNRWDRVIDWQDELDELQNTVYNLRLYLTAVKTHCESTGDGYWGELEETFDSLPGFVEVHSDGRQS